LATHHSVRSKVRSTPPLRELITHPSPDKIKLHSKGRSKKKRFRYDYEQKAKVVAYYDSLAVKLDGVRVRVGERLDATRKYGPVNVDSSNTVRTWTTQKARSRIKLVFGRSISDYGPGVEKIVFKGGRIVRAAAL
jgi:hypothetical protein